MRGYVLAFGSIFLWSWNVIISSFLADSVPPFQISFLRWFIASICLLPFLGHTVWKKHLVIFKDWKTFLLLSFGLAFMNNFVYQAGHTTSAVNMSLLATIGPIFLIIFSWILLGKKVSQGQIFGFLMSFIGVLIVISNGSIKTFINFQFASGNLWMIAFAVCFGIYGALEEKMPKNVNQFVYLSATIFTGTLMLFPFFLSSLHQYPLSNIKIHSWLAIAYLGIFNSIFAYLIWNIALSKLGSFKCSLIYYTLPIFSSIWAYFLFDEKLVFMDILGALFVFTGIGIGALEKK